MEDSLHALTMRGDSRIQRLIAWKRNHVKFIWTGGLGTLFIGVLLAVAMFTSTNANGPAKSASVRDEKPIAATAAETKPAASQPSNEGGGAAGWIPVYPGSTPEITSSAQTPESDQNVATFKTADAPPKVVLYFQNQLKSSGFNIKAASSGEASGALQAEDGSKKRSLVLNVNALPDEKGASARVVTVEKR